MAPERSAVEEAVSRAIRDNLDRLQRTAEELHRSLGDTLAACASARPANALPAMLRAQTAAASLAASLEVMQRFIAGALHGAMPAALPAAMPVAVVPPPPVEAPPEAIEKRPPAPVKVDEAEMIAEGAPVSAPAAEEAPAAAELAPGVPEVPAEEVPLAAPEPAVAAAAPAAFDLAALSSELQDMHRRANRVAKVTMQDIKMYKPDDVKLGRQNHDLCERLREDLDKAKKDYDRRFKPILDHPVDYFHKWMVEILAEGDASKLGNYPYPSPGARR